MLSITRLHKEVSAMMQVINGYRMDYKRGNNLEAESLEAILLELEEHANNTLKRVESLKLALSVIKY